MLKLLGSYFILAYSFFGSLLMNPLVGKLFVLSFEIVEDQVIYLVKVYIIST